MTKNILLIILLWIIALIVWYGFFTGWRSRKRLYDNEIKLLKKKKEKRDGTKS
jgi:hypothetical protein